MARYTKNGGTVENTYDGYTVDWYCKQVTDITVNTTTVNVTINVYAHFVNSAHIYYGDLTGALVVDNKVVNRAPTQNDIWPSDNTDVHLITRNITYTRSTSAATHTVSSYVQVTGGAWEGTSSTYNNRLTITIPTLPSYTITYNANGGSNAPATGQKWYNQAYTVSSTKPTRSGYTFVNWKIKETGNTVSAGGTISANSNNNYTLEAQWTANIVTISHNANGGVQSSAGAQNYPISTTKHTASYNSTMNLYNIGTFGLSKTGYHTDPETAWNTKADGSGTSYHQEYAYAWTTFGSLTASQTNITLYANWKINSYTLTANANGGNISSTSGWTGTGLQATKNVNYNATYGALPEPTRTNYTFNGWYTDQTGGTKITTTTKMGTANTTIYAQWTKAYTPPKVRITAAKRASRINNSFVDDDEGVIPHIIFTWTNANDAGTQIRPSTYDIKITEQVDTNPQEFSIQNQSLGNSPVSVYLNDPNFIINTSMSYDVEVKLHVNNHEDVSAYDYISQAFFIMDINADGTAIGFGGAVEDYIKTKDTTIVDGKAYYIVDENEIYTQVAEPTIANLSNYYEVNKGLYLRDNNNVMRALFDFIYPVGSYYETSKSENEFNPNVVWGGIWVKENEGIVHVSGGATYLVSGANQDDGKGTKDGGEKTHVLTPSETATKSHSHKYDKANSPSGSHTLTESEIPSHTHTFSYAQYNRGTATPTSTASALQYSGSTKTTDATGGGGGHSHTISTTSTTTTNNPSDANGSAHNNMQPYIIVIRWHRIA